MSKHTPLYEQHLGAGAKMVDFSGWQMPIHYGSQIEEHHAVRRHAGLFDVSHMNVVDVRGAAARDWLRYLLANDVARLKLRGKALYTCMLNENGGVVDDLIVYYMADDWYRLVLNAATRDKDLAWMTAHLHDDVAIEEQPQLAMLAVQGPAAIDLLGKLLTEEDARAVHQLKPFQACQVEDLFVARTGYTGEDGVEIILDGAAAPLLFKRLLEAGVQPTGLGARDTLRLEAGMALYGSDMDDTTTPFESGLGWTVALQDETRDFVGRAALEQQREQGVARKMVGLLLTGRGVLRAHQVVRCEAGEGEITSGSFSPTLGRSIALARMPAAVSSGGHCEVEIRGNWQAARIVDYPFVRHGAACINLDGESS
jgi:aminomethyltransferase